MSADSIDVKNYGEKRKILVKICVNSFSYLTPLIRIFFVSVRPKHTQNTLCSTRSTAKTDDDS